jgi:ketosteroid isomerase-like protein
VDDRAALEAAEHLIVDAIRTGDIDALRRAFTEDFVHSAPGAPDQDFEAFAAALRSADHVVEHLAAREIRARVFGETALLLGIQDARVKLADGRVVTGSSAFADVFRRTPSGWRVAHAWSVEMAEGG